MCLVDPTCFVRDSMVGGAKSMLTQLGDAIDTATKVDLHETFIGANYKTMFMVAVPVVAGLFLVNVMSCAVQGGSPVRALTGVFKAAVTPALVIPLLILVLAAVDNLSAFVLGGGSADTVKKLGSAMGAQLDAIKGNGTQIVLALFLMVSSIVLWAVLILRKIAIIATIVFAPLALAGYAAAITSRIPRRWGEALAALILSKLVIAGLFALAISAVGTSKSMTTIIGGLVLLLMASFSPWMCLRLIHFLDVHGAGETMRGLGEAGKAPVDMAHDRLGQARELLRENAEESPPQPQDAEPADPPTEPADPRTEAVELARPPEPAPPKSQDADEAGPAETPASQPAAEREPAQPPGPVRSPASAGGGAAGAGPAPPPASPASEAAGGAGGAAGAEAGGVAAAAAPAAAAVGAAEKVKSDVRSTADSDFGGMAAPRSADDAPSPTPGGAMVSPLAGPAGSPPPGPAVSPTPVSEGGDSDER